MTSILIPTLDVSISIASWASTGKSTFANILGERYRVPFYDGGDILKAVAQELGYTNTQDERFWESKQGLEFLTRRTTDPQFDKRIDEEWIRRLDTEICTGTSWTMAWLYKGPLIRIWLQATMLTRAQRLSKKKGIPVDEALTVLKIRDQDNYAVYYNAYGIRYGADMTPFDMVLDFDGPITESLLNKVDQKVKEITTRISVI